MGRGGEVIGTTDDGQTDSFVGVALAAATPTYLCIAEYCAGRERVSVPHYHSTTVTCTEY